MCISVFFFFSDNCIKQIDSMLLRVCSVIDHRGRQNVVKTSVTHLPVACVPLFCLEVSRYPAAGNCFKKLDTRKSEILTSFLGIGCLIPLRTKDICLAVSNDCKYCLGLKVEATVEPGLRVKSQCV